MKNPRKEFLADLLTVGGVGEAYSVRCCAGMVTTWAAIAGRRWPTCSKNISPALAGQPKTPAPASVGALKGKNENSPFHNPDAGHQPRR